MGCDSMHECNNEERIVKLESTALYRHEKLEELQKKLGTLNDEMTELSLSVHEVNSIFHTLKWIVSIGIAIFGGIFCFLLTELIKIV